MKLDPRLTAIALRRLGLYPTGGPSTLTRKLPFLAELARLGFEVENPQDYGDQALEDHFHRMSVLTKMRGGEVGYVPLFSGFPNQVPEDRAYFQSRMLGFLVNFCHIATEGPTLELGTVVPSWLFDLNEFGADPIFQMQDGKLYYVGEDLQRQRKDETHTEWLPLRLASPEEIHQASLTFLQQSLYSATSIPEHLRADLEVLLDFHGTDCLDPARIVFRETKALLQKHHWKKDEMESVDRLITTPTDWLRLFAALTDSDVSLSTTIRYPKLKTGQKKRVLASLEKCSNLCEDLFRYRGLWLACGRGLHPGAYARRFPRTAQAFHRLRNEKFYSFEAETEMALTRGQVSSILPHLRQRPTLYLRRLQQLLWSDERARPAILEDLPSLLTQTPLRNLLVLQSYWLSPADLRTVVNRRGKMRVLPWPGRRLSEPLRQQLAAVTEEAILQQLRLRPSWKGRRLWMAPELARYTVPLSQRKASPGMLNLGRGSRIPLSPGKVLRLFVYWKERGLTTDLDLSVIQFDEDFRYRGHVSYTNLQSQGLVHSGDLQSAPFGAVEFIDCQLEGLRHRYLAPLVYRYCGSPFSAIDCHSGWMVRDKTDCDYKSFDLKTVQNKFDLQGNASYCIPILVDVSQREILYSDLYVSGASMHNRVEGSVQDVALLTRQVAGMLQATPNLLQLLGWHLQARGGTAVENRDEADLVFSPENFPAILSELL